MELTIKESYNTLKTLIKEHWVIYDCPGGLELITKVHLNIKANKLSFTTKSGLIVYPGNRVYILNAKNTPLRLFNDISNKSVNLNIVTIDVNDITKYKYFGIIKLNESIDLSSDIKKLPETIFIEEKEKEQYLKYTLMVDVIEENIGKKEYRKYYIVKYIDHNFNIRYTNKYKPEDLEKLTFISPLKIK